MAPNVSIILPFYNAEDYLQRSIESACAQTELDIELVCVDDGSTDASKSIAQAAADSDSRVKLVCHEQNKGRLSARLTGIEHTSGEFIMFLDADDELRADAVERVLAIQQEGPGQSGDGTSGYDIVHFAFDIRYEHYVSDEARAFDEAFNMPPNQEAFGDDVVHLVFRDRRTTWSLCAKLMRSALVKRAAAWIEEAGYAWLETAEDACMYFIVAQMSNSYRGVPGYAGYIYNMDIGGSLACATTLDMSQFRHLSQYADAMEAIGRYAHERAPQFALDVEIVRYEHLIHLSDKLYRMVDAADKPQALDYLVEKWSAPDAIAGLSDAAWFDPAGCLGGVAEASCLQCPPRTVKTIATYHHEMGHGGAERVSAQLAKMWVDAGYRVVMLADVARSECVFDLPDEVVWVQLPATSAIVRNTYAVRAHALAEALRVHKVDMLVHHQWWNPLLCWDMMLAKASGVPVCAYVHSIYTVLFRMGRPREYDCCRVLRHADAMVVLSDADRRFWLQFNPRVFKTNNPPTVLVDNVEPAKLAEPRVVWVGRLTSWDKQPLEAIEIFARVHQRIPEATLDLVGPAPDEAELAALRSRVHMLGLDDVVNFVGETDEVMGYYQRSSVHLLTSAYEGWCLALVESKAAGVPCVAYDMPYLTLFQDGQGLIAVGQGERDAAAARVIELLEDKQLRSELGAQARASAKRLEAFDYASLWNDIVDQAGGGSPVREGYDEQDVQWDMMLQAQEDALELVRADAFREIEGSRTYRLGNALAAVPRFIRDAALLRR